ncbi:MAG: site-2 protease family protein, partial [Firmicutes bacterium]|nr:site-2 protease family protein [Bacillota bacterium]
NFRGNKGRGMLLVSLAGPLMNFLIAVAAAVLMGAFLWNIPFVNRITDLIIQINVVLAIFNLIPVPPLDGSKILAGILPGSQEWLYKLEQYGSIVLILLLFTGIIGRFLGIFITPVYEFLTWVARTVNSMI